MYYVLSVGDDYPESYWFKYDHKGSPNYLVFQQGRPVSDLKTTPVFRLDKKIATDRLMKFDLFMSDGVFFVSRKFAALIESIASDDIQLVDADVWLHDKRIEGCKIAVVTHTVECIDMTKSEYAPMFDDIPDSPLEFSFLEFIPGALGQHLAVRPKEAPSKIVISENFKRSCDDAGLKGLAFLPHGVRPYEE